MNMKPVWFVEPGYLEWNIVCLFKIGEHNCGLREVVAFESHRRATDKSAHLSSIIQFMTARRDKFIAEGLDHA